MFCVVSLVDCRYVNYLVEIIVCYLLHGYRFNGDFHAVHASLYFHLKRKVRANGETVSEILETTNSQNDSSSTLSLVYRALNMVGSSAFTHRLLFIDDGVTVNPNRCIIMVEMVAVSTARFNVESYLATLRYCDFVNHFVISDGVGACVGGVNFSSSDHGSAHFELKVG